MLVLSRHRDESILIGEDGAIVITVVDIRGDKCRLGIMAPIDIPVHRQEVYEAIQREGGRTRIPGPVHNGNGNGDNEPALIAAVNRAESALCDALGYAEQLEADNAKLRAMLAQLLDHDPAALAGEAWGEDGEVDRNC